MPDDILRNFECSLCWAKACKIFFNITQHYLFESALGISGKNFNQFLNEGFILKERL